MHHLIVSARKTLRFEEVENTPSAAPSGPRRVSLGSSTPAAVALSLGSSTPAAAASRSTPSTGIDCTPLPGRALLFEGELDDPGSVRRELLRAHLEAEEAS